MTTAVPRGNQAKPIGSRPRISAVVNTLNEEANIGYCLSSLRWCDEIVVVDMHSTDSTVATAREFTSKVFLHERMGLVEPARQFAVDRSTGEWVLIMDADEMVTRLLSERLRQVASEDEAEAVEIARKNFILGEWIRHTAFWPDHQLRFFKRGTVTIPGTIHTAPKPNEGSRSIRVGDGEDCCIYHFAYRDLSEFVARTDRYTTIEAREMRGRGETFDWASALRAARGEFMGRCYDHRGVDDGDRGITLSAMMGFYRFLQWLKLWELENNPAPDQTYQDIRESLMQQWDGESRAGANMRGRLRRIAAFLSRK